MVVGRDGLPCVAGNFESWPEAQEAEWIRYLIVNPTVGSGFIVYKYCPTRLKSLNPGLCFDP